MASGEWTLTHLDKKGYAEMDTHKEPMSVIPKEVHKGFNRHIDMLPNPDTRVPLQLIESRGVESTYCNANFITDPDTGKGSMSAPHHIAAMAPMSKKVEAFWRLIYEQSVPTIVMLTGLVEGETRKCPQYWPPDQGQEAVVHTGNGDIKVKNERVRNFGAFRRTTLKVKGPSGSKKTVQHWWYTEWPDHGVPVDAAGKFDCNGILDMLAKIDELKDGVAAKKTPQLVHCSAGVGRTGAIVALQHCIAQLKETGSCDILHVIDDLRNDRCMMVQKVIQYEWLHDTVIQFAARAGKPVKVLPATKAKKVRSHENQLFDAMDFDHDMEVTAEEFVKFVRRHVPKAGPYASVAKVESLLFPRGQAHITRKEFHAAIKAAPDFEVQQFNFNFKKPTVRKRKSAATTAAASAGGGGAAATNSGADSGAAPPPPPRPHRPDPLENQLFDAMDADSNGELTTHEFLEFIREHKPKKGPYKSIAKIQTALGLDRLPFIHRAEFVAALKTAQTKGLVLVDFEFPFLDANGWKIN